MTHSESVASNKFFSTISALTKDGALSWSRLTPESYRWFEDVNAEKSFQADYKGGTMFLLLDEEAEDVVCQIIPGSGLSPVPFGEPGDSNMTRLYEQIRAAMPTPLEAYIDAVINDNRRSAF